MGTRTFDGIWFLCFADDHGPPHIHCRSSGVQVIVELLKDGSIIRSDRRDAVQPENAKRSDVRRILRVAAEHEEELHRLWEAMHGPANQ